MKTNCWIILGTMLATTVVAQVNTNKLPEIPPPAIATPSAPPLAPLVVPTETRTNAPAKKAVKAKKKPVKKASTVAKASVKKISAPVTLVAGPATVDGQHVNLRGQAGLKGEVVGHVAKGETVTVISQINLDKHKAGEPAQWAKIALPASVKVWVDAKYVDASNNVVTAKKLNLRGGPGENYSVLGVIEKGAAITPVTTKDGWTQIEPPANSFAFVAASLLKQDTNAPLPVVAAIPETVPPPPTPTPVPETQPIAPPATTPPPTLETTAPVPPPATVEAVPPPTPVAPVMTLPQPTLAPDDTNLPPPPPRIVTHEGSVRHSVSPVAPTDYELFDPANDKAINYLFSTTTNLNLSRYSGLHITVTGEEGLDVRWKDTPVLTIQKIYVLSGGKPAAPAPAAPTTPKKHWWSK